MTGATTTPALGSIAATRRRVARTLESAGIEQPDLDARVLIGHALGLDHTGLAASADRVVTATEAARIATLMSRRLAREPIAHIVGSKEFWGLPLLVTSAVLVPRPDTETVVEAALAWIDARGLRRHPLRVADLCTGSGALLLALLTELPAAIGVATDCSLAALDVAKKNATRLGLSDRALFVACDFGAALCGGFDLVVANPPYIATDVIATLAPEVRDHDPRFALDGGADGLAAYRTIACDAGRLLGTQGRFLVEIGERQQTTVEALFRASGLAVGPAVSDLAGIPRVVSASR